MAFADALYDTLDNRSTLASDGPKLLAGRYKIVRELGRGGMGEVYLADDTMLDDEKVAVKVLPTLLVRDARAIAALKKETLLARRLSHNNIVRLHGYDEADGGVGFIVMDYAHSDGVVHRDLKPGNVKTLADSARRATSGANAPGSPVVPGSPTPENDSRSPGQVITNSIGMKLAFIPAGEFMIGSPDAGGRTVGHRSKIPATHQWLLGGLGGSAPSALRRRHLTTQPFRRVAHAGATSTSPPGRVASRRAGRGGAGYSQPNPCRPPRSLEPGPPEAGG
jgi:hypothetical protein